jgi:hypothetical protein
MEWDKELVSLVVTAVAVVVSNHDSFDNYIDYKLDQVKSRPDHVIKLLFLLDRVQRENCTDTEITSSIENLRYLINKNIL